MSSLEHAQAITFVTRKMSATIGGTLNELEHWLSRSQTTLGRTAPATNFLYPGEGSVQSSVMGGGVEVDYAQVGVYRR